MANLITSVSTKGSSEYELFIKPFLEDPIVSSLPMTFKQAKLGLPRDVYFNTQLDKVARGKTTCGWDFVGGAAFTKKPLTPIEIGFAVEQCYTVFANTIFADGLPDGYQRGELSEEIRSIMMDLLNDAINRDLLSILFLGNDALSADVYYCLMDGIYQELLKGVAAADGTVDSGVSLTATTLNTTNFFNTMNEVWNARTRQLKSMSNTDLVWIWTDAVYQLYLNYLEVATQNTAGLIQTNYVTDGLYATNFKGVKIVVPKIVDERLETDFLIDTPPVPNDPYRVILTNPKNHIVLLDAENGFANADVFYDKLTDKVYAVGSVLMDYQYGYGDQNVIAGF